MEYRVGGKRVEAQEVQVKPKKVIALPELPKDVTAVKVWAPGLPKGGVKVTREAIEAGQRFVEIPVRREGSE